MYVRVHFLIDNFRLFSGEKHNDSIVVEILRDNDKHINICNRLKLPLLNITHIECMKPHNGTSVRIKKEGPHLSFCDVEVKGFKPGT